MVCLWDGRLPLRQELPVACPQASLSELCEEGLDTDSFLIMSEQDLQVDEFDAFYAASHPSSTSTSPWGSRQGSLRDNTHGSHHKKNHHGSKEEGLSPNSPQLSRQRSHHSQYRTKPDGAETCDHLHGRISPTPSDTGYTRITDLPEVGNGFGSHHTRPTLHDKLDGRMLCHMAVDDGDWEMGRMRPRISSMPSRPAYRMVGKPPVLTFLKAAQDLHKVRSFAITPRGVINQGDKFVSSSTSIASSEGSDIPNHRPNSRAGTPIITSHNIVMVLGETGVGKRALIHTFLEPENSPTINTSIGELYVLLTAYLNVGVIYVMFNYQLQS